MNAAAPSPTATLLGGGAALASAFLWAAATLLWDRLGGSLSPEAMNLGKGCWALVLFAATFACTRFSAVAPKDWLSLGLSGLLGIALGDTLFFASLVRLGPRRSLLLTLLIPVLVALGSRALLGERLGMAKLAGIGLCLAGVAWVMRERSPESAARAGQGRGLACGALSALSCAAGVLLAKSALRTAPALEAAFIRLLVGTAGLAGAILLTGRLGAAWPALTRWSVQRLLLPAAFAGTYLGIWLSNAALRYAPGSIATMLNATSPLFMVLLAAVFLREPVSARTMMGTSLAALGAALLLCA